MFKELEKKSVKETEGNLTKYWKEQNILQKSIDQNNDNFVFYDGPATANGMPGIHHMLAKLLKDTFCKYQTMKGHKVLRKVGWDTHGLPVEVNVEKQLGFSGKTDIEKYGIKEFNQKCRESVWENEASFRDFTDQMGQFIDLENPYVTYDNSYIETEWWILKKFFDEGLIYEGLKILPYCPRCGTGLSSHEVAQGYKNVSVNTVTVPLKLKEEDTYLLVWTTTPWTLMANVAACVNPNEEYVKCESKGYNFVVAKKLADAVLGEGYTVLETYKGTDLEHKEYEQLLPFIEPSKKAFYIVCDDYVTMDSGTGIVHIAPAFGQDDYEVGLKYGLPAINPVDEQGKYMDGPWKGRFVLDSELEIDIIKYLASEDKLFKKQKIEHDYPHCWRCGTPLLYYSKPSLYIKVTDFKDKIIEANKTVNWYPNYVGEKRFGNWLENLNDWAISRNRYWGTPIPLWKSESGELYMVGSVEELRSLAIEEVPEDIDLHRPYVDNIHIKSPKTGDTMTRVEEVMDCWFDSGAMPFAQYHYPFENKELFESQFPADFISEGIDQTRGWFYSLLVISTFVMGKSPYKNVLVNDLVLDKNGGKMHKSKGNAVSPFNILDTYGADATRFYMLSTSPVWTPLKFNEDGIKEVNSKFFGTLKNTYNFFAMYANADNVDPRDFKVEYKDLEEIDKWLISKYNKLVKEVNESFEEYDLNKVVKAINYFLNEDVSNWYIRRNRRRFWSSELDVSKKAVYQTTYEILVGLCKLIAPVAPFVVEEMFKNLTDEESVHLTKYPEYDKELVNDSIEVKMDLVRDLISLGRNVREEAKIKVRQPISEVLLDSKNEKVIDNLTDLIKEELNVKEVVFIDDLTNYMELNVKPNFKLVGPIFGKDIKEFVISLNKLTSEEVMSLYNGETIKTKVLGKDFNVTPELVDIRVSPKDGFNVATLNDNFVILNTELTKDLILEGIAREMVSKVQNIRKEQDYNIVDRITLSYSGDEEVIEAVNKYEEFIKAETLSTSIEIKENLENVYDLNGHEVYIKTNN